MTEEQLEILTEGSLADQRLLLWYAVCNYYEIIQEFAIEVLHEKFLALDMILTDQDYQAFILKKMDWHPELEEITESTQNKIRTVMFRMMREANLIDDAGKIQRILMSSRLVNALKSSPDFSHHIYPAFSNEFGVD